MKHYLMRDSLLENSFLAKKFKDSKILITGATGSFGVESSGAFRSILAASSASDTLLGAISGVSNGFQIKSKSLSK